MPQSGVPGSRAGQGEGLKSPAAPFPGPAHANVFLWPRHFANLILMEPWCGTQVLFMVPREMKGAQLVSGGGLICTRAGRLWGKQTLLAQALLMEGTSV